MKSDNTWDLGTEGGQQRLLIPTAGVTAAYAEQAHLESCHPGLCRYVPVRTGMYRPVL